MKIKIFIINIMAIMIILMLSPAVSAATGTVEFKSNTDEVNKGEEFTVTLSANSEDGINGVSTTYSYDTEKLELVSEGLADSAKWTNMETSPNIFVICNSSQSIKSADLYTIKFKVKDNVSAGDKINIQTTEILLDTDAQQTDSSITIPSKKIEITVKDDSNENPGNNPAEEPKQEPSQEPTEEPKQEPSQEPKQEPSQEPTEEPKQEPSEEPKQDTNEEPKQDTSKEPKSRSNETKKEDKTVYSKEDEKKPTVLPRTGKNRILMSGILVLSIAILIFAYKKYSKYKGI